MPSLAPVDDPDDPRIADYRDIRERDLVGRQGRFVAEGEVVLRVLLGQRRFAVESLLLSDRRVEALRPLLDAGPLAAPVYVAPQAVMDRIAGFPIHRGVLALGRQPPAVIAADLVAGLPADALVVAAIGIANHDNMGGLFRNAAAFGVDAVLLDPTSCDPLYRKAIRVSVGGSLLVPFARADGALAVLAALRDAGFRGWALSPRGDRPLAAVPREPRTALILGAEGAGLPASVLAQAPTVRIPLAGGFDSLNVATASGIALHHLRQPSRARPER